MLIKNRIKEVRKFEKMSIRELAKKAGIHYTRLSMAENGRYLLSDQEFERLCEVLDCNPLVLYPDPKIKFDGLRGRDWWQSLKRM